MERTHGRQAALVIAFVACLAVGQAAHASNFAIQPNGNCSEGDVSVSGSAEIVVDGETCTAEFTASACAEKEGDAGNCCATGTCSPTIDQITLYTLSPTIGSCTANGMPVVLCEEVSCSNPAALSALLGSSVWNALYSTASIQVEWTVSGVGSGVSWGNLQAINSKEPPNCELMGAPTLSEWGMILMAGLLALGGIQVLRRRMNRSE